jgi:hypothetical protein
MLERDIEAYLVSRVEALGGEVRKVQWVGRRGAPDRLVMMPERSRGDLINRPLTAMAVHVGSIPDMKPAESIWVEVKAPGLAASFPSGEVTQAVWRELA